MAQYSTSNLQAGSLQALTSTAKSLVNIAAATATLRRAYLYEFAIGPSGAPAAADCEIIYDLVRSSTAPTGSAATPSPLDAADAAAGTVSTVNVTAEPTTGVNLGAFALNQRNSQRWLARDEKSRLVIPAANLAGIALRAKSTGYTGNAMATLQFEE